MSATKTARFLETSYTTEDSLNKLVSGLNEDTRLVERRKRLWNIFNDLPIDQDTLFYKYTTFRKFDPETLLPEWKTPTVEAPIISKQNVKNISFKATRYPNSLLIENANGVVVETLQDFINSHEQVAIRILETLKEHERDDKFGALAGSFTRSTLVVYIPPNMEVPEAINLLTAISASGVALFSELIIYLDTNSSGKITEFYLGSGESLAAANLIVNRTHVILNENSRLEYSVFQKLNDQDIFIVAKSSDLKDKANLTNFTQLEGSEMSRVNSLMKLFGEHSEGYDLFNQFGSERQRFDVKSELIHTGKSTIGQTHSRAVMMNRAESILRGLIHITKSGVNADSWLTSHGLTVGKGKIVAIPALQIDQNDIAASHSASVEPLNKEKLFYIESRGITEEDAKSLLIKGYFEPVIKYLKNESVKELARTFIAESWETKKLE